MSNNEGGNNTSLHCCATMDIFWSSKLTSVGMTKVIQSTESSYVNILNNVDFQLEADFHAVKWGWVWITEESLSGELLLPLRDKL
jgi:hypothetical protein